MFPVSGSCDFSCVLEAVGTPPFVVLGVVAQGFVEGDFSKYFARWGCCCVFRRIRLHAGRS